jgi:ParB family transcriptional regulator, chromosome partitioning protein
MELEFHQLDRRWEHLRVRRPEPRRRLLASLASGQQTPIVVVAIADQSDRYLVIDGYKRIAALQQLGRDTVEAVVWPLATVEALVLDRSIQMSAHLTALEEGWLLAELEEHYGYGLEELGRRFDRSLGWVMRRLALVDLLPKGVQQQVRDGKLSAHVATKFLAPVAQVSLTDCQRMADAFARHRFSVRQAGELYAAWRDGSAVLRQRLLEQPELFLKARRQAEPPSPSTPAGELRRDLDMVVAITRRAQQRVKAAALEMDQRQRQQARRQIDRAVEQLQQVATALSAEEPPRGEKDVEQRSADRDSGTRGAGSEPPPDRSGDEAVAPHGVPRRWFEIVRGAGAAAAREGRTLPPGDPRTVEEVQREPGPGP